MTYIVQKNRIIKKTLEQAFGRGNIRVRGSRGNCVTTVDINYKPRDLQRWRELEQMCKKLLRANNVNPVRLYISFENVA